MQDDFNDIDNEGDPFEETPKKAGGELSQPVVFAAILYRGGKKEGKIGADTYAPHDFYQMVQDFETVRKAPSDRVVIGETITDLQRMLQERHPSNDANLTYLWNVHSHYLPLAEDTGGGWRRRTRYREEYVGSGWKVLDYPMVTGAESIEELQRFCIENKSVYITSDIVAKLVNQGWGHADTLKPLGFVVYDCDPTRITFNPHNLSLKKWRQEKECIEKLLNDGLPPLFVKKVAGALCPSHWPGKNPLSRLFRVDDDAGNCIPYALELLKFVRRQYPRQKFWRKVRIYSNDSYNRSCYTFPQIISHILPYVWGVEDKARKILKSNQYPHEKKDARIELEFCQWLREEAAAIKVPMPDKPVVPPKPLSESQRQKLMNKKGRTSRAKKDLARKVGEQLHVESAGVAAQPITVEHFNQPAKSAAEAPSQAA